MNEGADKCLALYLMLVGRHQHSRGVRVGPGSTVFHHLSVSVDNDGRVGSAAAGNTPCSFFFEFFCYKLRKRIWRKVMQDYQKKCNCCNSSFFVACFPPLQHPYYDSSSTIFTHCQLHYAQWLC